MSIILLTRSGKAILGFILASLTVGVIGAPFLKASISSLGTLMRNLSVTSSCLDLISRNAKSVFCSLPSGAYSLVLNLNLLVALDIWCLTMSRFDESKYVDLIRLNLVLLSG